MKQIIILLMFLLIVSSVFGFSKTTYSGEDFTHGDVYYSIYHDFGDEKLVMTADGESFFLRLDECTERGTQEYCFTGMEDGINGTDVKYVDGEAFAQLTIAINDISPSVTISRTIENKILEIDETTTIAISITNNGKKYIDSFTYEERYPDQLRITQSGPEDNRYEVTGSLAPGQTRNFEYLLIAKDHIKYDLKGILKYIYANEDFEKESSVDTIEVEAPYELIATVDKSEANLGEIITYTATLNNDDKDLEIRTLTIYPDGLEFDVIDDNLTLELGKLTWSGKVDANKSITFQNKFKAVKAKSHEISFTASLDIEGKSYKFSNNKEVKVNVKEPDFSLTINPESASGGSQIKVEPVVENKDDVKIDLLDATLTIFGEIKKITKTTVDPFEKKNVFDEVITAPDVAFNETHYAKFKGQYRIEGLPAKEFEKTSTIKLHPVITSIKLIIEAPETVKKGDFFEVTVKAESQATGSGFIKITDTFPEGLYADAPTTASVKIEANQTIDVYTYKVKVPRNYAENEVIITSTLKDALDLTSERTTVVKVEGAVEEVSIKSPTPEPVVEREKKGFFARIISGLKGFWRWVIQG